MTRRVFYWPILIIGVLLIVAPFAISLPSKQRRSSDARQLPSHHATGQRQANGLAL